MQNEKRDREQRGLGPNNILYILKHLTENRFRRIRGFMPSYLLSVPAQTFYPSQDKNSMFTSRTVHITNTSMFDYVHGLRHASQPHQITVSSIYATVGSSAVPGAGRADFTTGSPRTVGAAAGSPRVKHASSAAPIDGRLVERVVAAGEGVSSQLS